MDLTTLTAFVTEMLAISIAAERMVELLKGWFPNFYLFRAKTDAAREANRCAWVQMLSGVCGAVVASLGHINILDTLPSYNGSDMMKGVSPVIAGLLASGGSAFWNHALDLLKATKVDKEQSAIASYADNEQEGIVDPVHPASFALASAVTAVPQTAPPCGIGPGTPPARFTSSTRTIDLKLVVTKGTFAFNPSLCSVTDSQKNAIPFTTATPMELVFKAPGAGLYSIQVFYLCTDGSTAELKENCANASALDSLDQAGPKSYAIAIA
jgi:hypothetical protein